MFDGVLRYIDHVFDTGSRPRDVLHLDWETAADSDLRKVGLDVYTSPRSRPRVLMGAYRINDRELQHWEAHKRPIPRELVEALEDPHVEKWGFHSQFERVVARRVLGINTPIDNWRCAAVLAYMLSFTGGLDDIGEQIGLPRGLQKIKEGRDLIRRFCVPQRITKNQPNEWRNWVTDPELWQQFCEYNCQDVVTEESIMHRLSKFPVLELEWDYYELDQLINDRGIPVDMDFIDNVIVMSEWRRFELVREMGLITGCSNSNSQPQLLTWLISQGYPYDDLRKENVAKALKRQEAGEIDLSEGTVEVLKKRQWAALTSVRKAVTAKRVAGDDGRARYLFQFLGASRTGRFAGREIQSQNMKRTPKVLDAEEDDTKLRFVTDMIREGDYYNLDLMVDEPMLALSGCMRGLFRAQDGHEFVVCDYSSVESAGLAWVSDCGRLLDVFRNKRDPYKDFGTLFYRKPYEDISRAERQICKPPTLGCGYRLSAGKNENGIKTGLLAYAENMGVEMTPEEAERAVTVFREGYPEIPAFWFECEKAIRHVLKKGGHYDIRHIRFEHQRPFLMIRLPSGRYIYYYKPLLERRTFTSLKTVWKKDAEGTVRPEVEVVTYDRTIFTYMGRNQKTTQWTRIPGHGGVITENVVQALTRDILMVGLMRLHQAGFYLVAHAHDEGMAEVRIGDNRYTLEHMRELMMQPIGWAPGFPLGAAGWHGQFYRK